MYCCYFLNVIVPIVIVVKIVTAVIAMKPSSSSTGRSAGQKWSERGGKSGTEKENLVHWAAGSHAEKHSLIILAPRDELQLWIIVCGLFKSKSNNTFSTLRKPANLHLTNNQNFVPFMFPQIGGMVGAHKTTLPQILFLDFWWQDGIGRSPLGRGGVVSFTTPQLTSPRRAHLPITHSLNRNRFCSLEKWKFHLDSFFSA